MILNENENENVDDGLVDLLNLWNRWVWMTWSTGEFKTTLKAEMDWNVVQLREWRVLFDVNNGFLGSIFKDEEGDGSRFSRKRYNI